MKALKPPQGKSIPVCNTCGESGNGVQFPVFPKTKLPFGTICVKCDDALTITPKNQTNLS